MSPQSEEVSLRCARLVTIIVVVALAAGIALANLASEPVTGDLIKRMASNPTRAYGWPLTWYWRTASTVPGTIPTGDGSPPRSVLEWPVVRHSARGLAANFAIWLPLVAGSVAICGRLLPKYERRRSRRPRVSTLVILVAAAAPTVLANMTFDVSSQAPQLYIEEPGATAKASFGWPLVWHWYFVAPLEDIYGWDFSAARLAGNTAIWLGTLALVAIAWEGLLRLYRPRLRFSLRTMLAATAVVAVLCAWCAAISKRADEQDALAASRWRGHQLWVERFGPKWFGLVMPDRYRRCVVGARINIRTETTPDDEDLEDVEAVRQLARLPGLRFLAINYGGTLTQVEELRLAAPSGALRVRADNLASLRGMENLSSLKLTIDCVKLESQACLAALGRLTRLRRLWLSGNLVAAGLAELAPLESLEQLTSDHGLATPAGIESLGALKRLRMVEIPGLKPIDVVPGDVLDLASSPKEAEGVRRALESLRRSHPGIAVNERNQGWWDDRTEQSPWFAWQQFDDETTDLDSFLAR